MAGVVFTMLTFPFATIKVQDLITGIMVFMTLHFSILGCVTSFIPLDDDTAQRLW